VTTPLGKMTLDESKFAEINLQLHLTTEAPQRDKIIIEKLLVE